MDAATLQAKIINGYRQAALRTGYGFDVYRPNGPSDPLSPDKKIRSALPAAFLSANTQDFNFNRSNSRENVDTHCMADITGLQNFDIFTNPQIGTYFLSQAPMIAPNVPPRAISCSQTVEVTRAAPQAGFGAQPYGGSIVATEIPLMTGGWPASIISSGARGEGSEVNLPGDVRIPGFSICLPFVPGVILHMGDFITDNVGRRFIVSSAELTSYGWFMITRQATT